MLNATWSHGNENYVSESAKGELLLVDVDDQPFADATGSGSGKHIANLLGGMHMK